MTEKLSDAEYGFIQDVANIKNMTVAQLRKAAAGVVPNYRKMNKVALVAALIGRAEESAKAATVEAIMDQLAGVNAPTEAELIEQGKVKEQKPKEQKPKAKKSTKCRECGKRPIDRKTQGADSTMCADCFEYAGWENQHSDDDHSAKNINADCPVCAKEFGQHNGSDLNISHPKAAMFANKAAQNGWEVEVTSHGQEKGKQSLSVSASNGNQSIRLQWTAGAYDYDSSEYKDAKGTRKVRNTSAALRILEG